MNRGKVNAVLAAIALLGAGASTGMVHAEEAPGAEVTTADPPASADDSATVWDKTRDVSGDAWEASKEGSARAWDKTREISGDAWDAAKEGSARAWDETGDVVQGEPQTAPGSEADANQDPPATPSPSS